MQFLPWKDCNAQRTVGAGFDAVRLDFSLIFGLVVESHFCGLCCNARSLTGIFTLAQNMGSAVHRWLQAWNMDPSITWTLLLRTWNQKITSNSSVFFAQLTYIVGGVWGLLGLHRRLVDSTGLVEKSQAGAILRGVWGWGGYHSQLLQMDGHWGALQIKCDYLSIQSNRKKNKYVIKESKKKKTRWVMALHFPII